MQPGSDRTMLKRGLAEGVAAVLLAGCTAAHDTAREQADLPAGSTQTFGPAAPENAFTAADGLATQHGDSAASDTSPLVGPGAGAVLGERVDLLAACPSLLVTSRGQTAAVCTQIANRAPAVFLLAKDGATPIATLPLAGGELFGGVYPYLDADDRLFVVDGANHLLRIAVEERALIVEADLALSAALPENCGRSTCDSVVGLMPDYNGSIWFATESGRVGYADLTRQRIESVSLPSGESIANSIATAPEGTAVVTDHALYLLRTSDAGVPEVRFRAAYERGPARKPGQLSHGSGTTPTFFGPERGTEYLAITDNALPTMHLLVFRSADGSLVCDYAVPAPAGLGSESSPIGTGRSVIVSSSYGYAYPALPRNAGASDPPSAALSGGMARIDVNAAGDGCQLVWTNEVRSAAVPKLSLADQLIYTFERTPLAADGTQGLFDRYAYIAIDAVRGEVVARQELPELTDTMQLAGTLAPDRELLQGTIFGFVRVRPAP